MSVKLYQKYYFFYQQCILSPSRVYALTSSPYKKDTEKTWLKDDNFNVFYRIISVDQETSTHQRIEKVIKTQI